VSSSGDVAARLFGLGFLGAALGDHLRSGPRDPLISASHRRDAAAKPGCGTGRALL